MCCGRSRIQPCLSDCERELAAVPRFRSPHVLPQSFASYHACMPCRCYACPSGFEFDSNGYCSPGPVTCTGSGVSAKDSSTSPPPASAASSVSALSISPPPPPAPATAQPSPKSASRKAAPAAPGSALTVPTTSETMASTQAFTNGVTSAASCSAPSQALCIGKKYGFYQDATLGCMEYYQCYDGGVQCAPGPTR